MKLRSALPALLSVGVVALVAVPDLVGPFGVRLWRYRRTLSPTEDADVGRVIAVIERTGAKGATADDLVRYFKLEFAVRNRVVWGKTIPENVFCDAVLPYRSLSEAGPSMRQELCSRYLAAVQHFTSATTAAEYVDDHLFRDYPVKFRETAFAADLNPRRTIAAGSAGCMGLCVFFAEACRAVGIPARIVGIASWPKIGGTHAWVEVWSNGWHHLGAAEHPPNIADHTWFEKRAQGAVGSIPDEAIYAVSPLFGREYFPASREFAPELKAVNVTPSYKSGEPSISGSRAPAMAGQNLVTRAARQQPQHGAH